MLKTKDTVLEIDNIVKEFPVGKNGKMTACNKVSLCFEKGKTLGKPKTGVIKKKK